MQNRLPQSYTLIGAGRVATALAFALQGSGMRLRRVASRSLVSARRLADRFDAVDATDVDGLSAIDDELVIVSVKDDAVAETADKLASRAAWPPNAVVLHTSGTWPSDVLSAVSGTGASVASFHPVQTFAKPNSEDRALALFNGVPIAIEGDADAVETAYLLAGVLGARPFRIGAEDKMLFHVAAVMASNYYVTLSALAGEIAGAAIGHDAEPSGYFQALSRQAVENLAEQGPEGALTGPVARGDVRVVEAHLRQIADRMPHLMPVYACLATETVRLAAESGAISHEAADDMLTLIEQFVMA